MRALMLCCTVSTICLGFGLAAYAQSNAAVTNCDAPLSKDYFSYARETHLTDDYLESIDETSYSQLKTDNDFNSNAQTVWGFFSASDSYHQFDEKRQAYLKNVHYTRNQSEAVKVLQLTTSDRAYAAYEACLRASGEGSGVKVWAEKESPTSINLRIKYLNPAGVNSQVLDGRVTGGSVSGAPAGLLWKKAATFGKSFGKWTVNQEKSVVVIPRPGFSDTAVTVQAGDGSPAVTLHFFRADAILFLDLLGTVDVLREAGQRSHPPVVTPDNNFNQGGCPNQVGNDQGKYCISRTRVYMSVAPPYFFRNPGGECQTAESCHFGRWATNPELEDGGQTVAAERDNFSLPVSLTVTADLWEHVRSEQCGGSRGPLPVTFSQSAVFSVPDECMPLATLRWRHLPDGSEGVMKFDKQDDGTGRVKRTSLNSAAGVTSAAFSVTH
jgi:hypothetical protein